MKLVIQDIRCFSGRYEVAIKPLTILTGENSAGKTTFLAALSAATNPLRFPFRPDFNQPPYDLGGFETIVSKSDKEDRLEEFRLGFVVDHKSKKDAIRVDATYTSAAGQVKLLELKLQSPAGNATFDLEGAGKSAIARMTIQDKDNDEYINSPDTFGVQAKSEVRLSVELKQSWLAGGVGFNSPLTHASRLAAC